MAANKVKPTLYALLGVHETAGKAQIQAAFRHQMNALEDGRANLSPDDFNDRGQLLRVAYDTLVDPVSRGGYDAAQDAAARASRVVVGSGSGVADPGGKASAASAEVRADALSMRADALSLRADALLMRGGVGLPPDRSPALEAVVDVLGVSKRVVRAIGLLAVLGMVSFALTRCAVGGSSQRRIDFEQKAAEQAALQDYYQTHGVRPANLADLQLLEATRQRTEREQREADQAKRQQEQAARRFDEESRRIGRDVSEQLRQSDEMARVRADRQQALKFRAEQLRLESELAQTDADRRRLDLQRKQVLEQMAQL